MNKLIKVTNVEYDTKLDLWINTDQIISFERGSSNETGEEFTAITMAYSGPHGKSYYEIGESIPQLLDIINK